MMMTIVRVFIGYINLHIMKNIGKDKKNINEEGGILWISTWISLPWDCLQRLLSPNHPSIANSTHSKVDCTWQIGIHDDGRKILACR